MAGEEKDVGVVRETRFAFVAAIKRGREDVDTRSLRFGTQFHQRINLLLDAANLRVERCVSATDHTNGNLECDNAHFHIRWSAASKEEVVSVKKAFFFERP